VIEYEDQAIVLSARPHAETGAIVHVLTRTHGHVTALVPGGASRRLKPYLQPGSQVDFRYRARSTDQLGQGTIEGQEAGGADLLDHPAGLIGLQSACVMTELALPERDDAEGLYEALSTLIGLLGNDDLWPYIYVRYELGLLEAIGFGLDLSACAVTGTTDNLVYVSPKSARAVSQSSGLAYADKLLSLPAFLRPVPQAPAPDDVRKGLDLTGFFFERHVFHPRDKPLPEIRQRLRSQFA
jgi:DNA repair protein RecO (recombination protein O)